MKPFVVDSLDNIQQMGSNTRNYAIAVNQDGTNGMVIFDADGNFKDGAQVVTHLADSNGNLGGIVKDNVSFA